MRIKTHPKALKEHCNKDRIISVQEGEWHRIIYCRPIAKRSLRGTRLGEPRKVLSGYILRGAKDDRLF